MKFIHAETFLIYTRHGTKLPKPKPYQYFKRVPSNHLRHQTKFIILDKMMGESCIHFACVRNESILDMADCAFC